MKKLINRVFLLAVALLLFFQADLRAIELSEIETRLMNDISRYIDVKPAGQALSFFEHAIRSKSVALKGLASIIMARHYSKQFRQQVLRNFTLNRANDDFIQEKKVLVRLENANKLLAGFEGAINKLEDERVRQLFLFFHFRHKNVWMLGRNGEELSLASFYRISTFSRFFNENIDPIKLGAMADLKK
ncbi:MAG: hypothetical protein PHD82_17615 [Candidatus Riflebacteria bacterium]|jgi:hypothetical protein|nr:hypothetical protein [Candidatus Riflebacteria bacterium]